MSPKQKPTYVCSLKNESLRTLRERLQCGVKSIVEQAMVDCEVMFGPSYTRTAYVRAINAKLAEGAPPRPEAAAPPHKGREDLTVDTGKGRKASLLSMSDKRRKEVLGE